MVYIFGMNFPLVEALVLIGFFIFLSVVFLVWTLFDLKQMNRKLDKIIKEERIVKHELDIALEKETFHVKVLADLLGNIKVIRKISDKKLKKLEQAERAIAHMPKEPEQGKKAFRKAVEELQDVDKLAREEEHVLVKIGKEITRQGGAERKKEEGLLHLIKNAFNKK